MTAFGPATRLTFGLNFGVFWFFIVFNFVRQIGLNRWRLVWFFIRRQWRFRKFQQFVQIRLQRLQINLQIRCHFFWENVHTSNVRSSPLFVVVYVFDISHTYAHALGLFCRTGTSIYSVLTACTCVAWAHAFRASKGKNPVCITVCNTKGWSRKMTLDKTERISR